MVTKQVIIFFKMQEGKRLKRKIFVAVTAGHYESKTFASIFLQCRQQKRSQDFHG